MTWASCSECGKAFGSDTGFDRHRVISHVGGEYDWRCVSAESLLAGGWRCDVRGRWRLPDTRSGRRVGSEPAEQTESVLRGPEAGGGSL